MSRPSVYVFYGDRGTLYFAAQKLLTNCEKIMENPANSDGQHFPSFFQNSSPGTNAKEASATEELDENRIVIGEFGPANSDGSFEMVDIR